MVHFWLVAWLFLPAASALAQLDSTWTVTVGGQVVQVNPDGSFRIPNISAPDNFGPGGPGTPPDSVSDDFVRLLATSTYGGVTRYAFSEFFQIRQGQTYHFTNLTVADFPPPAIDSLAAVPDQPTLTALGQTTQVRVTALLSDGSILDVTPRSRWTSYRTSNPNIAIVNNNGLVTAVGQGMAFITAVNEGATAVAQVDVAPGQLTIVSGIVLGTNGLPVAGAVVSVAGQAIGSVVTDAAGRFVITNVATAFGPINLAAEYSDGTNCFKAAANQIAPLPGAITDAGLLTINPLLAQNGLVAWWTGDGEAADLVSGESGAPRNGAGFVPGIVEQAFVFDGTNDEVVIDTKFPLHESGDATLEFWLNSPFSAHQSVFWTRLDDTDSSRFNIYVNGDGTFGYDYRNPGSTFHGIGPNVSVPRNQWAHLAITRSNNTYRTWVNAVLRSTVVDTSPNLPASVGWQIAGRSGLQLRGSVDEIAFYNRALASNEITAIYAAGSLGKCKDLPPRVVRLLPTNNAIVTNLSAVSVTFSRPIALASLTADTFVLTAAGVDALFDTADDQRVTNASLRYNDALRTAFLDFATVPPTGAYRASIRSNVTSLTGRRLETRLHG